MTAKLARSYSFKLIARTPIIHGFNDSEGEIDALAKFIRSAGNDVAGYELLPYHNLGKSKYEYLGREYSMRGVASPSEDQMGRLCAVAAGHSYAFTS